MTVAALEAVELGRCVARSEHGGPDDRALARQFFAAAAKLVDIPWSIVCDSLPPPDAPRPPVTTRLARSYTRALQRAATDDPVLALALLRVMHLVETPQSLTTLACIARVARGTLGHIRPTFSAVRHRPAAPPQLPDPHGPGNLHHPRTTHHETGRRT